MSDYWDSQWRNADLSTLEYNLRFYLHALEIGERPLIEAFESRCDQLALELPAELIMTSNIDYLRNKLK